MSEPAIRRIALLCTGLEEGRNGVGDYCRLLAKHLSAKGIEICLIALNDWNVQGIAEETGPPAGAGLRIVRISHRLTVRQRLRAASGILASFRPDWVSLHFVCYGFDTKGLVYREVWWLPLMLKGYRLHVMFHETWIGVGVFRTRKTAIVGALQRLIIFLLFKRLRASVVSTSNEYYIRLLQGLGLSSTLLPLFGNIPIAPPATDAPWIYRELRAKGGPDLAAVRRQYWIFGIFGAVYDEWPIEPLLAKLCRWAEHAERRIIIAVIGATSKRIDLLKEKLRQYPSVAVLFLGPRSTVEISQFFATIDFGLTSQPIYTLGKSGSVAAMLEHGVPVIANWGDIAPDLTAVSTKLSSLIWKDDELLQDRLLSGHRKVPRPDMAEATAMSLLDQLLASTRPGEC